MMTRILSALFLFTLSLASAQAHASKASHFKGLYEVLSEASPAAPVEKKYVLIDVDTLENIWARYATGDLPANLVPIKLEPAIIMGFTFRPGIFFNLEANAMVGANMLAMAGAETDRMQLMKKSESSYELTVRIKEVLSTYQLGPRQDIRGSLNKKLIPALHID